MTVLQAPIDLSDATRVGGRVYRKQILEKRTISYPLPDGTRRQVAFDDAYLTDLATAFQQGAYELVPLQLADPANRHNEDPRQYGGRVIGVEKTADGLDAIIELSAEAADLVERTGRKLGVSARIKEALEHVDGRRFPRAIRHVLGTLDPRMQGLRGWEPIDLSVEADPEVIDLTGYDQEGTTMSRSIIDLSALDDEQREALASFAAANGIELDEPDDVDLSDTDGEGDEDASDEPDGSSDAEDDEDEGDTANEDTEDDEGDEGDETSDEITDDELDALIEAELAGVELSTPDDGALDLAAAEHATGDDTTRLENASLRFQLASAELARRGVPPYLIDLAEPVLSLPADDTLDLSSPATGEAIDVRSIVTGLLDAVAGTIDLSSESGYAHETEPDEQVQTVASAWTSYLNEN